MKAQKLESIIELASLLAKQSDFQEILRLVTHKVSVLLKADTALIMMINPQTRDTIKTIYKAGHEDADSPYQLAHTYFSGWVIENNSGFVSGEIKKDRRFRRDLFNNVPLHSVMCVPFRFEGKIIGTLLLLNKDGKRSFQDDDLIFLDKYAIICSPFLLNTQKLHAFFQPPLGKQPLVMKYKALGLLGRSEKFVELLQSIESAARSEVRVMLEGETGTGKELIAKAIHLFGTRASNKFIAIDCGAIPRDLIESELFGHLKGAFTGAVESRKGLMEEASEGTLFMDEISNLPQEIQVKLLRAIQEQEIRPVGSNEVRKINVRIITASSRSLRELVDSGAFREDLYYRLYVYPVEIPSLNQRIEDIPLLAKHFLKKYSGEQKKPIESFSEEVFESMKNHTWSGNIRELENLVERLVTLASPEVKTIDPSLLPQEYRNEPAISEEESFHDLGDGPLKDRVAIFEKQVILDALKQCNWNQSAAARKLQTSEHAIRYKMKNYGISRS